MGVSDVKPAGKFELDYSLDGVTGQKKYTVTFSGTDDSETRGDLAAAHNDIPDRYDVWHSSMPWLRCVSVKPVEIGPLYYEVIAYYSTQAEGSSALNEPAKVSWRDYTWREAVQEDANGVPIVNSAGEPFDVEKEFRATLLRVERNEATFNGFLKKHYRDSVNANEFLGASAETCWMKTYDADRVIEGESVYYSVIYEIVHRHHTDPDGNLIGWKWRLKDQGFRVKTGTDADGNPTYEELTDDKGQRLSEPVALDGSGSQLADGADSVFLDFDKKDSVNWRPLGLENVL